MLVFMQLSHHQKHIGSWHDT